MITNQFLLKNAMKKEFIKSKLMVYQLKALNFQEVNREFMEVEIQNSKWVGFFKMSISRKKDLH